MPAANWSTPQNILKVSHLTESVASPPPLAQSNAPPCGPKTVLKFEQAEKNPHQKLADLTSRVEVEVGPGF